MCEFKTCGVSLDTVFKFAPNSEDAACVDLDGDWSEQSKVFRHPDFVEADIVFVSGEVGEGGDHVNINLKNVGDKEVVIPGDKLVAYIDENPEAVDPNLAKQVTKAATDNVEEIKEASEKSMEVDRETSDDTKSQEEEIEQAKEQVNGTSEKEVDDYEVSKEDKDANVKEDDDGSMEVDQPNDTVDATPTEVQTESNSSDKADDNEKDGLEEIQETTGDSADKVAEDASAAEQKEEDSAEMETDNTEEKSIESSTVVEQKPEEAQEEAETAAEIADSSEEVQSKITLESAKDMDSDASESGSPHKSTEESSNKPEVEESTEAIEMASDKDEADKPIEAESDVPVIDSVMSIDDISDMPVEEKTDESEKPTDKDLEKPTEQGSEKTADDGSEKTTESEKDSEKDSTKSSDKSSDNSKEDAASKKPSEEGGEDLEKKKSPPPIMMRFVNETEAPQSESEEEEEDRADTPEGSEDGKSTADSVHTEVQVKEEDKKDAKPKLKLASFANHNATKQESPTKAKSDRGGCTQCQSTGMSLRTAVVWEAMQFCTIACLSTYQNSMSRCSSCNQAVNNHIGKYCVRFGSDIKQFCSNACLEDYKKGLKVCSYCQKDISGGEGFLAPIGNKGQFKDFCDQNCLHRFQELNKLKEVEIENGECQVCRVTGPIGVHLIRETETIKFCEKQSCVNAYKFANKVDAQQCKNCKKHFDEKYFNYPIFAEGGVSWYCSQACQNVAIMITRKITPCTQCRVKKYNFDMIEVYEDSSSQEPNMYCSLHCRTVLKQAEQQAKSGSSVPVISDIFSNAPFAGGMGVPGSGSGPIPTLPQQPLPPNQLNNTVTSMPGPPPLQLGPQMGQMPPQMGQLPPQLQPQIITQPAPPPQIQIQTQTVTEVVKEVKVLPAEVTEVKNKSMQTKPYMVTKAVSCKPMSVTKETQTEGDVNPTLIPIPIPMHIPTPCAMYNAPYPVLIPIPMPFPVPIFIPTTRNSMKGIMKQIKKIQNKIPADPFEAELLALAGDIANEDKDSDSEYDSEGRGYDDDDRRQPISQEPIPDLENEMTAERIVPKPLPISTPEPPPPRQFNFGGYPTNKRGREDGESDDEWRPQNLFDQRQPAPTREVTPRQPQRRQRGRSTQQVKRQRTDSVQPNATPAIPTQPKERPDANHHLKFTYGVNAWKHWVVGKNAELEKQRAQGKYQKSFETDILKLRADELNFTLCMFVKEVKKPNGDQYAADSILYLVLGIQEYLFENGRIDNIFTDVYYDPFTTALHEVVKDFKLPVNELGYFVTRIEEEHLWESKQLGAHSPQVLLNTLVYFNTKYFQLKTPDEHLKLSFSHIMKHWKKTIITKAGEQQRTVLLRYYPPPQKGQKNEDRKMYEQHENTENPLRCPVKLYEFYLSKCPESTKNRNDMFYLQPERSCVPDSPVWYSQALLNKFNMEKMLARLLMVREVQEHMLADQ